MNGRCSVEFELEPGAHPNCLHGPNLKTVFLSSVWGATKALKYGSFSCFFEWPWTCELIISPLSVQLSIIGFCAVPTCCIIYLLSAVRVLYILHACAKFLLCISGSSRQFTGFSTDVEESIINRIWERAGVFFPTLRELSLLNFVRSRKIRVGLRPYSKWALWVLCALNVWWKVLCSYSYWVLRSYSYCEFHCNLFKEHHHAITEWCQIISVIDGKPLIGPIPGIPKVFLATGHEGEGLCMVSFQLDHHLMSGIRLWFICFHEMCSGNFVWW